MLEEENTFTCTAGDGRSQSFLVQPDPELLKIKHPRILSIGCGSGSIYEVSALTKFYENFTYVGVDISKENVDAYKIPKNHSSYISIINADASSLDELKKVGINPNTFDVAIVRHPYFEEESREPFKKIFRITIPTLLKQDGILIVSLYQEKEKIYLVRSSDKENFTIDTLLLEMKYNLLSQHCSNTVCDQFAFYFKNKCNLDVKNYAKYIVKIPQDIKNSEPYKKFLFDLIPKIGGIIRELPSKEIIIEMPEEYWPTLTAAYPLECLSKIPPISKTLSGKIGFFTNEDEAKKLNRILSYFKGKNEKNPPTVEVALRRAASGLGLKDDNNRVDSEIIVKYLIEKTTYINAGSPSTQMTALHLAVINNQINTVEALLAEKNIDTTLKDKEGKTAEEYAKPNTTIKNLFLEKRKSLVAKTRM